MKELQNKVLVWANDKKLLSPNNTANQLDKFTEETAELEIEVNLLLKGESKLEFAQMELGDVLVTLTILAKQLNTDLESCLQMAYDKIKVRKGKTINGTFIKH